MILAKKELKLSKIYNIIKLIIVDFDSIYHNTQITDIVIDNLNIEFHKHLLKLNSIKKNKLLKIGLDNISYLEILYLIITLILI